MLGRSRSLARYAELGENFFVVLAKGGGGVSMRASPWAKMKGASGTLKPPSMPEAAAW
jgi:hypothetical protein